MAALNFLPTDENTPIDGSYTYTANNITYAWNGSSWVVSSGGAGGVDLSAVAQDIIPSTTDTYDIGSPTYVWQNIYTGDLHLSNDYKEQGNDIDGTKGDWTIQEGEENLYIINNKNGKKFKFSLEEIQ
jgi:hypothetical protein